MTYSKKVFTKAEIEINRRHINALSENEHRQNEIEKAAPEIAMINNKLINTSAELSKALIRKDKNLEDVINKIKDENLKAQENIKIMLKDFRYPENYLDINYYCKKCNDTGYVNGIRCSCFNELLKKYSIEEMNSNSNIKLADFGEFDLSYYSTEPDPATGHIPYKQMSYVFSQCKEYVNNFSSSSESLFLYGKTGLGKTLLSSAIAKSLLEQGYNVAFDSIQNFLREIENEHFGRSTEKDSLQILNDADLLILDDLGSEFQSQFYMSALYNILNTRINKGVPTIVSSNLSLQALQEKYDDRIISRLTGMFTMLNFIGKDIRHIKQMKK